MKYKKTIIIILAAVFCVIIILKVFFTYGDSSKSKGTKHLLELIDEKGIELDEERRKWLEEKVKEEEEIEKQATESRKWYIVQRLKLIGRWKKVLEDKIKEADRIEIQEARPAEPNMPREVLHVIKGNDKVQGFLDALEISEWRSSGYCACHGNALLVFYKAEGRVAALSYHHNERLRWHDGPWTGDAELTKKSKMKLPKWFESRGYSGFEDINRRRLDEQNEKQQFMKYFPEKVQKNELGTSIENPIKDKLKELDKKYNDREVAKIYSSSLAMASATYVTTETEFVRFYLGHFKGKSFSNALNELENNAQGMLGAACIYFRYISLLDTDPKYNLVKGDCKLTDQEKERFGIKLAPYILNGDVNWQKRFVVRWLSELNNPKATSMLFDIARGRIGREVGYDDDFETEPGIRATAYLYLVQRRELTEVGEVKEAAKHFGQKQDVAALKLALCLLGDSNTFDEDYLSYPSFTIGYAALEVIEKNPIRQNIDILVNTGIDHPYGMIREDAKYLFQKITKADWLSSKEEKKKKWMSYTMELEKIREWWKENRDKYE